MNNFSVVTKTVGIKRVECKAQTVQLRRAIDMKEFMMLVQVMGLKSAMKYQLGIAQEGVDFW